MYICPTYEKIQNRMQVFEVVLHLDTYFKNIACRN
jgi:hypothetical protein